MSATQLVRFVGKCIGEVREDRPIMIAIGRRNETPAPPEVSPFSLISRIIRVAKMRPSAGSSAPHADSHWPNSSQIPFISATSSFAEGWVWLIVVGRAADSITDILLR